MSYLEIYNENIRDLLQPSSGTLDLREDAKSGVIQVAGLSKTSTTSTTEVSSQSLFTSKLLKGKWDIERRVIAY